MPSVAPAFTVTPIEHGPESKVRMGVVVEGLQLNDLDDWSADAWDAVKNLVFEHKIVVFKKQGKLEPEKQLHLMKRYAGAQAIGMHSKDPHRFALRSGASVTIPDVPECQVVGYGRVPAGHYGLDGREIFQRTSKHLYRTPLTAEEEEAGIVRLVQLHYDSALYEVEPPEVGSLFCVKAPQGEGEKLTLRFDNGNEGTKTIAPGSTIYFDMSQAYELLSEEERRVVDNSRVAYAPRAFTWMSTTRFTEDGASIYSEGREMSLEDVPEWEEDKCKTYPMVWINPLNGQKSLQIHGQAAWKLYLRDGPEGEERVVEDLAEVRSFIHGLHRRFLKPEYAFAAEYEEGDALIWYNMGLMHSATEYPTRMGDRVMHQINVTHTGGPERQTLPE